MGASTSGAPLLGATDSVRATLSGVTFGLPVGEVVPFTNGHSQSDFAHCFISFFVYCF